MMKIKEMYLPLKDFAVTIAVTVVLICIGGINNENSVIGVFFIYVASVVLTNANKYSVLNHNQKNKKKQRHYMKKHKVDVKNIPNNLRNWDIDVDMSFQAIKLVIGLVVTMILAVIVSLGNEQEQSLGKLAYGFYIDAFLLPLMSMLIEAFWFTSSPKRKGIISRIIASVNELIKSLFIRNGKKHYVSGLLGLIFFALFLILAIKSTVEEFYVDNPILNVIFVFVGIIFVIYSFLSVLIIEEDTQIGEQHE